MRGRLLLTLALAVVVCPRAFAQSSPPDADGVAPAHVAYVEGTASLEREGRADNAPLNMPLLSGDRLKTADGRVEVLFGDGSALHMDARTTIDVQSDDLVRLIEGRLRLNIVGPARTIAYRVDSPAGSVRITQPGEYRLALLRGDQETQLELAVLRGAGEIFTDEGTTPVRAGERAYASAGLAPSYPYSYNSANWDSFDRWSESRRDARLGVSTQYLPSEVRTYASTFDEYGDWRYQPSYGYVWYPRVAVGWRPYYYGRWASYPRYGWTWVGADAFAWPTHHYGRWGFTAGAWFWIPAARWAPAYVSWAYSPGYVSWCPLGFDNRPVIGINIFSVRPGYYASSRAWTVIASSRFGRDGYVHQRAVNWDRFDRSHRPTFEIGRSAPAYRGVAVPRNSTGTRSAGNTVEGRNATPIRWAGSRDLPSAAGTRESPRREIDNRVSRPAAGDARGFARQPAPGGGTPSPARESAVPRYINRGDEIVRSQTGRPTAPRGFRNAPDGGDVRRTAPAGPMRQIEAAPGQIQQSPSPNERQHGQRAAPSIDRAQPRTGGGMGRPDAPAYQPRYEPRSEPRSYEPRSEPRSQPRAYEPRAAEPRSRTPEPRPTEARQPPPERSAPAPERAAPARTATPRAGGGPGRPRGGRGGV